MVYVLALPLISRLSSLTLLVIVPLSTLVGYILEASGRLFVLLIWLYPFIIGCLFGRESERISTIINRMNLIYINLLYVILTVVLFYLFDMFGLILAAPLFIFIVRDVYRVTIHHKVIEKLGKHSIYMWLTHSFFCYYYTPEVIYSTRHSPLILLALILISYAASIILTYLDLTIKKLYGKLKHSLSLPNQ